MSESTPHDVPSSQEEWNELRTPEVNTTLFPCMRADETAAATSPPSASAEANSNPVTDCCATAAPASPPNHPTRSSISLSTNASDEFLTIYVSDSDYGDGTSSEGSESSFAIIHENPSSSGKETPTTRPPANDHLSSTLPSRMSSQNGHNASAVSTPSQVSTNQAKARSGRAKKWSSTAMDFVNANVRSRTSSKGASSSLTPKVEDAKEEKKSKSKGRDRKVKFIVGPSPCTSSDEETEKGKSSNGKRGSRPDRSGKFIIGPDPNSSSESEEEETKKENTKRNNDVRKRGSLNGPIPSPKGNGKNLGWF
ncbi:hypothetical protein MMC29_008090 [Sticta canariensis]|nr:hypothetical protein [Sticta canariensis]